MSKHKAPSRPFSIVLDDITRSPDISNEAYRLYSIMLSYCPKTGEKKCTINRRALAGLMKMSIPGVTKVLHQLRDLKLIEVSYEDPQCPAFTINISPPSTICPEELKGRRWGTVLDHVATKGGIRENQTRRLSVNRRVAKRTGWPIKGDQDINDDGPGGESCAHHPPTPVGGTPQLQLGTLVNDPPTPVGDPPNSSWGPSPTPVGGTPQLQLGPMYIEEEKSTENRPYGLAHGVEGSALVPLKTYAPAAEDTKTNPPYGAHTPLTDISVGVDHELGAVSEDTMRDDMAYTPEDRQAEIERKRKLHKKDAPRHNTGSTSTPEDSENKPAKRSKKPAKATETDDVVQEITEDPDKVTEVPSAPWGLYTHFCKVVKKKWPDAQMPGPDGKALKLGSLLLKQYSRTQLYEMIRVLVLDFENLNKARLFFKNKGPALPVFTQLYSNAEMLVTFIGAGVIEPPGIRYSAYMADFDRRHGYATTTPVDGPPRTSVDAVDEVEAVRAKLLGGSS